jgi:hypothetical protein|tara:strand:+ start:530 stop:2149 length:1620 start_codon:yes stop_codon:yes gene_type:complete
MALRSFNSVSGFSVGQDSDIDVVSNIGNVTPVNLTVSELSDFGPIANITITGGTTGQVIQTDGSGTLSFADTASDNSAAPMPYIIVSGDSYVVPENFQGLYSQAIDIEGTLEVDGILIEVGTSQNAAPNEVYYDNNGTLTGNSGFTFLPSTGNLALPGNVSITGNVVPNGNITYDLGTSTNRWKDLYLSGTSIFLGTSSITEDADGDVVLTNGDGGTWTFGGTADLDSSKIANGTSNVSVLLNGDIRVGSAGNANVLNVDGSGVLTTTGNVVPLGVKTDNYYYANGDAITFGTSAAGANTQIQYNNNGDFGAEAAFTYDQATNTLSADNIAGTLTTVAQPNITSLGTLTSLTVTGNATAGNVIASDGTVQYGTNPGSGSISVNTGTTTAGIFATNITDINLGLAANIIMGATGKTVTARGNVTADNLQSDTLSVGDFYSSRTAVSVGSANTVIDSFPLATYRSAKYTIKVSDSTGYQALEALLVHDDINSIITVYGSLSTTGSELMSLSTAVNGTNIELRATPVNSSTSVNLMGTYVPD